MSTQKQVVTVRDLVEEAKKRIVILAICVVGLSYLMSLTSSSVWFNLPAAACLIILLRYFSLDFEMRRKAAAYNSKVSSGNALPAKKPPEPPKAAPRSDWRSKVNSRVVEDALDHFTRRLISEWVTDLWYSRITPDKEGPEELVFILNGVLGELSRRFRNVNLIDLLTRDLINIICRHLELFRECQTKIEKQQRRTLPLEDRDIELRRVMADENKLHPALFSPESEHKVLQHLMNSLISLTFRPEDLQCAFFRYTARELLACCVMRPVLNLATPRFVNERIEAAVISRIKTRESTSAAEATSQSDDLSKMSPDHFSRYLDPSVTGVELVQLKNEQPKTAGGKDETCNQDGTDLSKDPLLSMDTRSSRSLSSFPLSSKAFDDKSLHEHHRGGEWSDMLDLVSRRKTESLAPEHLESVWAKGRNYKRKEGEKKLFGQLSPGLSAGKLLTSICSNPPKDGDIARCNNFKRNSANSRDLSQHKVDNAVHNLSNYSSDDLYLEDEEQYAVENTQTGSSSSYTSEDEETDNATGLNSPGTRVWDGRTKRSLGVSSIHHPLENSVSHIRKKSGKGNTRYQESLRKQSGRKRFKQSSQNVSVWQEVERKSLLSGDGQDILSSRGCVIVDDASDDSDTEFMGRVYSGTTASSSGSYLSLPESGTVNALKSSLMLDSFAKLRCEVLGANIVKSSSRMFTVYSIAVTDESNHSWSIKRRFRHFEELHRRLKEFPEYNLHLPPKHFLSTGLDIPVIQERCVSLDNYLKKLLQLPRVSGSIEVWDFLSVDSQTYAFSSSFSIMETLTVKPDHKPSYSFQRMTSITGPTLGPPTSGSENLNPENGKPVLRMRNNLLVDDLKAKDVARSPVKTPCGDHVKTPDSDLRISKEGGGLKGSSDHVDTVTGSGLPTEWVPPKLTLPLLDLVDVVFQLQEGGWIRRKAFWVAKQILQLGMGDALDDWLLEKIRLLHRGAVVAAGIQRVEQILWPDGIFITKHPKRRQQQQQQRAPPSSSSYQAAQAAEASSPRLTDMEQKEEADRRAKFVYELMTEKAPATIVSLVGHKEYEQCAKDLYFFLQSSVCLKQLAFNLLELLLLSAFPEMDQIFKQLHQEKHKFGEFKVN